jgi:flagellar basal body-associated protein FliL
MEEPTQRLAPLPVAPQPSVNGPPPPPPPRGTQNDDNRDKRRVIIAAIIAGLVAVVIAAATVVVITSNNSASQNRAKTGDAATYQRQMSTAVQPLVVSNQQLSVAMNAADGSPAANNAIKVGLKNVQTSLTSTQGAVGSITVPVEAKTLSQQTSQALTQENGYLQVVSATFTDSTSASPIFRSSGRLPVRLWPGWLDLQ